MCTRSIFSFPKLIEKFTKIIYLLKQLQSNDDGDFSEHKNDLFMTLRLKEHDGEGLTFLKAEERKLKIIKNHM